MKKTTKKKGAQPNNKNAVTHGFYSAYFIAENKKLLDDNEKKDGKAEILSEINLTRVLIKQLLDETSFDEKLKIDINGNKFRDNHYLQQLAQVSVFIDKVNSLVRTYHLTHNHSQDDMKSILEAIEALRDLDGWEE